MNKYLEKIASSKVDRVLSTIVGYGDRLIGHSASKAKNTLRVLQESTHLGGGIPQSTLLAAKKLSGDASQKSFNTRVKTGLTVAGAGTAGYFGIHKYQQHQDNKIMRKLLQNAEYNSI